MCPAYLMFIKYNTGQCKWQGFKNFGNSGPARLGALPHIPCTVRPAWERGSLGTCLGGRLPGNAVRVLLGLRLRLGGGSPGRSVLASSFVNTQKIICFYKGSSAMPQSTNKKLGGAACRASCTETQ